MPALKITKRAVDAAPVPAAGDAYFWDTELKGFGLRVTPRGVRSYVLQFRMKGRPARRKTIGIHGSPWTPDKARTHAEALLFDVKRGIDPVDAERARSMDAARLTFEKYVDRFVDGYLKTNWADSWQEAQARLVAHVVPALRGRSLIQITRSEVADLIDGLADRPALARNTHAALRKLFAWAVDRGDLAVSPMSKAPPAVGSRKRVLSPDEIVALWRATYELNDPFGAYVRLLLITLQRRREVAGLPWGEVDKAKRLWTIPGTRAKNDTDHLVPLSDLAMAELTRLSWKDRGLAFTTTGKTPISGFSKMKASLDRKMVPILQQLADEQADALDEERRAVEFQPWVLHDLRRTGTTQMQGLRVPIEVTEKVINHRSGETAGIRGVYNLWEYIDEKREALDKWARHLDQLVKTPSVGATIVSLEARRA